MNLHIQYESTINSLEHQIRAREEERVKLIQAIQSLEFELNRCADKNKQLMNTMRVQEDRLRYQDGVMNGQKQKISELISIVHQNQQKISSAQKNNLASDKQLKIQFQKITNQCNGYVLRLEEKQKQLEGQKLQNDQSNKHIYYLQNQITNHINQKHKIIAQLQNIKLNSAGKKQEIEDQIKKKEQEINQLLMQSQSRRISDEMRIKNYEEKIVILQNQVKQKSALESEFARLNDRLIQQQSFVLEKDRTIQHLASLNKKFQKESSKKCKEYEDRLYYFQVLKGQEHQQTEKQLEDEKQRASAEIQRLKEEIEHFANENSKLANENSSKDNQINQLHSFVRNLEENQKYSSLSIANLMKSIEEMKNQILRSQEHLQIKSKQVIAIKSEYQLLKSEFQKMRSVDQDNRKIIQKLEKTVFDLSNQLKNRKIQLQQNQINNSKQSALLQYHALGQSYQNILKNLKTSILEKQKEIRALEQANSYLRHQNSNLLANGAAKEGSIKNYSSSSDNFSESPFRQRSKTHMRTSQRQRNSKLGQLSLSFIEKIESLKQIQDLH